MSLDFKYICHITDYNPDILYKNCLIFPFFPGRIKHRTSKILVSKFILMIDSFAGSFEVRIHYILEVKCDIYIMKTAVQKKIKTKTKTKPTKKKKIIIAQQNNNIVSVKRWKVG